MRAQMSESDLERDRSRKARWLGSFSKVCCGGLDVRAIVFLTGRSFGGMIDGDDGDDDGFEVLDFGCSI